MTLKIILTGDVNLMNVSDPKVPFGRVASEFRETDFVFSNLECCLYNPTHGVSVDASYTNEGFFVDPRAGGEALRFAGIQAVGIANNVNYGSEAITSSIAHLDDLGLPHTGAGANAEAARAPLIVERKGIRIGVLQRTAIYWGSNHEATPFTSGVAAVKCHTAYQIPFSKLRHDMQSSNRPGLPPLIKTWVDPKYSKSLAGDIAALRAQTDFVVASFHWGLKREVADYMTEMAHIAIDAGADVVMGHGPHFSLPLEMYEGKPVYYGLGSFSFHTGHGDRKHGNWVGMLARIKLEGKTLQRATFQFVRHNDDNETFLCELKDEQETFKDLEKRSAEFGARLRPIGNEIAIEPT